MLMIKKGMDQLAVTSLVRFSVGESYLTNCYFNMLPSTKRELPEKMPPKPMITNACVKKVTGKQQ